MRAFLISPEGRQELLRVITLPTSLKSLKRPKFTLKATMIFGLLLLIVFSVPLRGMADIALLYVFSPVFLIPATIPLWIATTLATEYFSIRAQQLIRTHNPIIIGVSGSYGKTSTKYILSHLLGDSTQVWHTPKSFNNPLSFPRSIVSGYQGQPYVVLEYASYKAGEISTLTKRFLPSMVVFTGLNEQHVALFGGYEAMIKAESEILDALKPGSMVIYNQDDPQVSKVMAGYDHLEKVPVSKARLLSTSSSNGMLRLSIGSTPVDTQLVASVYASNVAMAIEVASKLGVNNSDLHKRLASFKPTEQFVRVISKGQRTIVMDDKTSNPTGVMAIIELSHSLPQPVAMIFGGIIDLGELDDRVHQRLGEALFKADIQLLHVQETGQRGLQAGAGENYTRIHSRKQLVDYVSHRPETTIIVEGHIPPEYQGIV